jgi:DNA-binding PadR family transcriptional regulator
MAKNRKLSTIEMTVLGLAWLRGPCTIYAIMKELSLSESSYHKSRAGTAYSVANRLIGFGLLQPVDSAEEGPIQITPAGISALHDWIAPPIAMPEIAHSADLIRLRFFFLGVLEPATRIEFIDGCIAGLEVFLTKCEALVPENERIGDYFGVLATLSTIFETRARIAWLNVVRDWVLNPRPITPGWSAHALAEASGNPVD